MSIQNLFSPNDYDLFCHSINTSGISSFESPVTIQGNTTSPCQLNLVREDSQDCKIVMGDNSGTWIIQRTGNNNELSIYPLGNSIGTNAVLNLGAGQLIQYGAGGVQLNGPVSLAGNLSVNSGLIDSLASLGTNGQVLTSTGSQVLWSSSPAVDKEIFLNSLGGTINGGTDYWIGQAGITITESSATYSFAKNATMVGMYVQINAAPGSGKSWTFTVRKNGVDTSLLIQISGVSQTSAFGSGSISYAAGDNYSLGITSSGTPASASVTYATLVYQ
jgi:hypothetical protein